MVYWRIFTSSDPLVLAPAVRQELEAMTRSTKIRPGLARAPRLPLALCGARGRDGASQGEHGGAAYAHGVPGVHGRGSAGRAPRPSDPRHLGQSVHAQDQGRRGLAGAALLTSSCGTFAPITRAAGPSTGSTTIRRAVSVASELRKRCTRRSLQLEKTPRSCPSKSFRSVRTTMVGFSIWGWRMILPA